MPGRLGLQLVDLTCSLQVRPMENVKKDKLHLGMEKGEIDMNWHETDLDSLACHYMLEYYNWQSVLEVITIYITFWAHLCLCTVGSYGSLSVYPSVCPSVHDWTKIHSGQKVTGPKIQYLDSMFLFHFLQAYECASYLFAS